MGQVSTEEDIADKKLENTFGEELHVSRTSGQDGNVEQFLGQYRRIAEERDDQEQARELAKYHAELKAPTSVFAAALVLKPSPWIARHRAILKRRQTPRSPR